MTRLLNKRQLRTLTLSPSPFISTIKLPHLPQRINEIDACQISNPLMMQQVRHSEYGLFVLDHTTLFNVLDLSPPLVVCAWE